MLLLPHPDAEGITQLQALYQRRHHKPLSDEAAAQLLGSTMRLLFLLSSAAPDDQIVSLIKPTAANSPLPLST